MVASYCCDAILLINSPYESTWECVLSVLSVGDNCAVFIIQQFDGLVLSSNYFHTCFKWLS